MNKKSDKKIRNVRVQVEDTGIGVYVWSINGKRLTDGHGNMLCINSKRGDIKKMAALRREVRSFGITDGKPEYIRNVWKVTQGEHDSMMERFENGLIPDPSDPGNVMGEV